MRSVATPALVVMLATLSWGGIVSAESVTSSDAVVDQISRHCLDIDNDLGTYPSLLKNFTIGNRHGVETSYGLRNKPQKLVVQIVGDSGGSVTELYFSGENLICLVAVEQTYGGELGSTASTLTEDRYYFVDGKVERWLHRGPKGASSLEDMQPSAAKLAALSARLNRDAMLWTDFLSSPLTDFETFVSSPPASDR